MTIRRRAVAGICHIDGRTQVRVFRLGSAVALALSVCVAWPRTADARSEQPWCANSSGHGITYTVCGFPTLAACREEIISMRGWCSRNPYYTPPAVRRDSVPRAKARKRPMRKPLR
jgi:hypothetical protein